MVTYPVGIRLRSHGTDACWAWLWCGDEMGVETVGPVSARVGAYVHPGVVETVVCLDEVEAEQSRQMDVEMGWRLVSLQQAGVSCGHGE